MENSEDFKLMIMYTVFGRTWWDAKGNPKPGRKTIIRKVSTIEKAREVCRAYNDNRSKKEIERGYKLEFTS